MIMSSMLLHRMLPHQRSCEAAVVVDRSSHSVTGFVGLLLLAFQGMLTLFFEDDPNARSCAH